MGNPGGDLQSTVEEQGARVQPGQGTGRRSSRAGQGSPSVAGSSTPWFRLIPSWIPRETVPFPQAWLGRGGLTQSCVPGMLGQNRFMYNKLQVDKRQR